MRSGVTLKLHRGSRVVPPAPGGVLSHKLLRTTNMAAFAELLKLSSFIIFAALLVISLLTLNLLRTKNVKYPPIIKGWIPWLGCAIEFGKAPLTFIKESSEKHGEVFTFYAIGQRMTFLTDVRDFHFFFLTLLKQTSSEPSKMQWRTRRESTGWISLLIIVKFMI